jgi:hypothetical protein
MPDPQDAYAADGATTLPIASLSFTPPPASSAKT